MRTQHIKDDDGRFVYILITPAKDEEDSLPELIQSIVNQDIKPVVWVIVDDGSDDKTPQIINQATSEYPWILSLKSGRNDPYDLRHVAFVYQQGFKHALNYCERNSIEFEFIASSDADTIYPKNYFSQLISFLHNNSEYGIISGKVLITDKKGNIVEENRIHIGDGDGHPYGTGRVWRKETFEETNGYPLVKAWDSVSNIMALLKGWKIKRLADVECYQIRGTGEKINSWNGYFTRGERAYYLNANFLNILGSIVNMVLISRQENSMIKSLAYFSGYFRSFIRRDDKIENDDVKRYMGSYKRSIRNYWLALKGIVAIRRN